ncbi:hypothetical protein [Massilia sp. DWR3-1-1]|uniref:hypothetical protein n=1 Tax=Massilia sp. DWR3-1-1 TaxID=2804559 RepID=UPI003CEA4CA9
MTHTARRTGIVPDRLATRAWRLRAAHAGQHGFQVMAIRQCAARLAGGVMCPIDTATLRQAVLATSGQVIELARVAHPGAA